MQFHVQAYQEQVGEVFIQVAQGLRILEESLQLFLELIMQHYFGLQPFNEICCITYEYCLALFLE